MLVLGWYLELGEKPEGTAQSYRVDGGWRRQAGRLVVLAGAPEGVLRWASGIPWRRPSPSEQVSSWILRSQGRGAGWEGDVPTC